MRTHLLQGFSMGLSHEDRQAAFRSIERLLGKMLHKRRLAGLRTLRGILRARVSAPATALATVDEQAAALDDAAFDEWIRTEAAPLEQMAFVLRIDSFQIRLMESPEDEVKQWLFRMRMQSLREAVLIVMEL